MNKLRSLLVLFLGLLLVHLLGGHGFASEEQAWILVDRQFTSSTTGPFVSLQPTRIGVWDPPRGAISSFANLGDRQLEYISQGPPRIEGKGRRNMHVLYDWTAPPQILYPEQAVAIRISADVLAAANGDYAGGLAAGVTYRPVHRNGRNSEFLAPNNRSYNLVVLGDGLSTEGRDFYHLDDIEAEFGFEWFGENESGPLAIDIVFNTASFHYRERYVYEWLPLTDVRDAGYARTVKMGRIDVEWPVVAGEDIVVNYRDFPGNSQDWLTIVPVNYPDDRYEEYYYTQGDKSGQFRFSPLLPGEYEVRSYFDWPSGGYTVQDRFPFVVAEESASPGVYAWTEQASYLPNKPITVVFRDLPGNAQDWITVVAADTPDDHYREFYFTEGSRSGEMTFNGVSPGNYEVRTYFDWPSGGYVVQDRYAFTVAYPTSEGPGEMSLARPRESSYRAGESVLVSFRGLPGSDTDWITIAQKGSSENSYVHYQYTQGSTQGELIFPGLEAGEYEIRVFFDWPRGGYTVQSRHPLVVHP